MWGAVSFFSNSLVLFPIYFHMQPNFAFCGEFFWADFIMQKLVYVKQDFDIDLFIWLGRAFVVLYQ